MPRFENKDSARQHSQEGERSTEGKVRETSILNLDDVGVKGI
jgi:hypothetical protein